MSTKLPEGWTDEWIRENMAHIWLNYRLDVIEEAMVRLLCTTPIEELGKAQQKLVDDLTAACESNPDGRWVDVGLDCTEAELSEAICRASRRACDIRLGIKRGKS